MRSNRASREATLLGRGSPALAGEAGFTMMEILVVLSIIVIILALLSPTLFRLAGRGAITEAQATIVNIKTALQTFATSPEFGTYPPTVLPESFLELPGAERFKPNNTNVGIESLVFHLTLEEFEAGSPFKDEKLFINLDADEAPISMSWTGSPELYEYADPWGNPYVYFNVNDLDPRGDLRFDITVVAGNDFDVVTVRPVMSKKFKNQLAGRSDGFQIISLGPDAEFGTDDDILSWDVSGGKDDDEGGDE